MVLKRPRDTEIDHKLHAENVNKVLSCGSGSDLADSRTDNKISLFPSYALITPKGSSSFSVTENLAKRGWSSLSMAVIKPVFSILSTSGPDPHNICPDTVRILQKVFRRKHHGSGIVIGMKPYFF